FTLMLVVALPLGMFLWFGAPFIAGLLFPAPSQAASLELCQFVTRLTAAAVPISAVNLASRYALQSAELHAKNAKAQMLATTVGAATTVALAFMVGIRGLAIGVVLKSLLTQVFQGRAFDLRFPGLWRQISWGRIL